MTTKQARGRRHRVRRALALGSFLAVAACGSADPASMVTAVQFAGATYAVTRESKDPAVYKSIAAYDVRRESDPEKVKSKTLLDGLLAARKGGAEYATYEGPRDMVLKLERKAVLAASTTIYPGVEYTVRGWKATDPAKPPNAQPIDRLIAALSAPGPATAVPGPR